VIVDLCLQGFASIIIHVSETPATSFQRCTFAKKITAGEAGHIQARTTLRSEAIPYSIMLNDDGCYSINIHFFIRTSIHPYLI